jgi:hypothetical protein
MIGKMLLPLFLIFGGMLLISLIGIIITSIIRNEEKRPEEINN